MSIQSRESEAGFTARLLSPSPDGPAVANAACDDSATQSKSPANNGVVVIHGLNNNDAASKTTTVTLVIPAKNEAGNIGWVLEQVPASVDEIIIVDGNSIDATLVTARSCRPDVHVVAQPGTGKGDALRAGFQAASG